jgi:hypothetical protein
MELKETYEQLIEHAEQARKEGRGILSALRMTIYSENMEAFDAVAKIAREMGITEEKIDSYRSSPLNVDLFTMIGRASKGGNKTLAWSAFERAIQEGDTEAIGHAANVAVKCGVPEGKIKVLIEIVVAGWQEEKNHYQLVMAARDMFDWVKEFLNPEFVAEMEAGR